MLVLPLLGPKKPGAYQGDLEGGGILYFVPTLTSLSCFYLPLLFTNINQIYDTINHGSFIKLFTNFNFNKFEKFRDINCIYLNIPKPSHPFPPIFKHTIILFWPCTSDWGHFCVLKLIISNQNLIPSETIDQTQKYTRDGPSGDWTIESFLEAITLSFKGVFFKFQIDALAH